MNKNIITTIALSVTFLLCLCFLYPYTYRELIYILFSPIFDVLSIRPKFSHHFLYLGDYIDQNTIKENFKKMVFPCLVFVSFIVTYSVLELILNENKPLWFQIFLYTISSLIFVLYLVQIIKYIKQQKRKELRTTKRNNNLNQSNVYSLKSYNGFK